MLGWENAFHCEINPFGRAVLEYWFPESKSYEDITKTDFHEWRGKVDVLTGGFPCQPFSYAGKRGGRDDERYLWPQMLRAIDEIRPTWVVGENVAGITTMVEGGILTPLGCDPALFGEGDGLHRFELRQSFTIERICRDLEGLGYSVQPMLIPAAAVGAPHRRDRIFILAFDADSYGGGCPAQEASGRIKEGGSGGYVFTQQRRFPSEWPDGLSMLQRDAADADGNRRDEVHEYIQPKFTDGAESFGIGRKLYATNTTSEMCNRRRTQTRQEREADSNDKEHPIQPSVIGSCTERITTYANCEGREESVKPRREENSEEDRARLDDRTERFGSDEDAPNAEDVQCDGGGFEHGGQFGRKEVSKFGNGRGEDDLADPNGNGYDWEDLRPEERWANFPTVSPVHRGNDGLPFALDDLAIPQARWRTESLKAYGNAIVPQVMYRIFQAIEKSTSND